MIANSANKKQLTIDTSFDDPQHLTQVSPSQKIQPTPRHTPTYCSRHDSVLKTIIIALLAVFNVVSLSIDMHFNQYWIATSLIHRATTFCCYVFVIMTTDLDEISNIKHSTNQKIVFCRFISYCDWIIAFLELAEGFLMTIMHILNYGLFNSHLLYITGKFILYIYMLKNV